jgi:hypothetical protein
MPTVGMGSSLMEYTIVPSRFGPYAERPVMPRWGGSLLVVSAG